MGKKFNSWKKGTNDMYIASFSFNGGGCDKVTYSQGKAMEYLKTCEKQRNDLINVVEEIRLYNPPIDKRLTFENEEELFIDCEFLKVEPLFINKI